jgi:hypothetical protein
MGTPGAGFESSPLSVSGNHSRTAKRCPDVQVGNITYRTEEKERVQAGRRLVINTESTRR